MLHTKFNRIAGFSVLAVLVYGPVTRKSFSSDIILPMFAVAIPNLFRRCRRIMPRHYRSYKVMKELESVTDRGWWYTTVTAASVLPFGWPVRGFEIKLNGAR